MTQTLRRGPGTFFSLHSDIFFSFEIPHETLFRHFFPVFLSSTFPAFSVLEPFLEKQQNRLLYRSTSPSTLHGIKSMCAALIIGWDNHEQARGIRENSRKITFFRKQHVKVDFNHVHDLKTLVMMMVYIEFILLKIFIIMIAMMMTQ